MSKGISVRKEVRKGKKVITVIANIPHNPQVIKQWASELKQLCGAGGTVVAKDIELQGDQVEKAKVFIEGKKKKKQRIE